MNFSAMANKDQSRFNAAGNTISCEEDADDAGSAKQLFFSQLKRKDQPSVAGQGSNDPACMQNRDKFYPPFRPDGLPPASQPEVECGGLLHHYTSHRNNDPHIPVLNDAGTDVVQQRHHSCQSFKRDSTSECVSTVDASKEYAEQPLRHFFDDWPRERDPSSISWMDQISKEEKLPTSNGFGTQLSISISMAAPASKADSDLPTCNTLSGPEKLSLPPLTLSVSSPADQESLPPQSPDMRIAQDMQQDRHLQQRNNIPSVVITWEAPVGGPLAEMLHSSSCTSPGGKLGTFSKPSLLSSGLNLLCEGWESDSTRQRSTDKYPAPCALASPAHDDVLQNAEIAAGDSGSHCSPQGSS